MQADQLADLLSRKESQGIDFKRDPYDLSDAQGKSHLIKDIISMANTPRDETFYIVIGVEEIPEGGHRVVGVNEHPDDADLQSMVRSKVYPHPVFTYEVVENDGKSLGVIHIPPERVGPCQPRVDFPPLRKWTIYWRCGTSNEQANPEEQTSITNWCQGRVDTRGAQRDPLSPGWEKFAEAVDRFDHNRHYILAIGREENPDALTGLGAVDWAAVVDLDPNTARDGLLSELRSGIAERRHVHVMLPGDQLTLNFSRGTYWLTARGMAEQPDSVVGPAIAEWNVRYGNDMHQFFLRFAKASRGAPTTLICAIRDRNFAGVVCQAAQAALGSGLKIVLAVEDEDVLRSVGPLYGAAIAHVRPVGLANNVRTIAGRSTHTGEGTVFRLPCLDAPDVELPSSDIPWLEEELEIVHLSAGSRSDREGEIGRQFLLGSTPTWYELGLRFDVDREMTDDVVRTVRSDLDHRIPTRINLYHSPGAGGTTVARRTAWQIHRDYPTVMLHSSSAQETCERLASISKITALPVLAIVEGADLLENEVATLYSLLRARQVPVVVLQVLRRLKRQLAGNRAFWLPGQLTEVEAQRFAYAYAREAPERRPQLDSLAKKSSKRRTAFYFGLEAFGRDFRGIESWVGSRLDGLSKAQAEALIHIAIAHHYGQQGMHINEFAGLMGLERSENIAFESAFSEAARDLIVEETDSICRTAHNLIAEEVLRQLLSPEGIDRRAWKQNLSYWARRFLHICRGDLPIVPDETLELVRRVVVYRENAELLGTERSGNAQFASLIEDIPSTEGRAEVLRKVTELFPDEPHFWAHLGRFSYIELQEFDNALDCLSRALTLSPDDHVLHHMRGMVLRGRTYEAMRNGEAEEDVIDFAQQASLEFEQARELQPSDEFGYVSEIQLLTRVVDHCAEQHQQTPSELLTSPDTAPWLREALGRAEELLGSLGRLRQGDRPSPYEEKCAADLHDLYGDHDAAIRRYGNLLGMAGIYAPPIRRQMVWTYLDRARRSWRALAQTDVDRVVHLLEHNLTEQPDDSRNIRLWSRAIRHKKPAPSLDSVVERVAYWKANTDDLDATYYLYVFHALKALQHSRLSLSEARRLIEECSTRAQYRQNRTISFEWVGKSEGPGRLIHQSELGEWDNEANFWRNSSPLDRIDGVVTRISGPQAGTLVLECGLEAFFVPGPAGIRAGRDENASVSFNLGFSYDGPRAWSVIREE